MINKKIKSDKGFTMLETMIYIALFGILMSGILVGTYNLMEGGERNINSSRIQEEGTFLNRKISWALTGAESVTVSGGNSMTIVRPDLGAQNPLVISGSGTELFISRGGSGNIGLNSDRFKIENVNFTYIASVNGRPPAVSSSFEIESKKFTFKNYLRQ